MGWKGAALGAWIGTRFCGPLGAILGAALGDQVEKQFGKSRLNQDYSIDDQSESSGARERSMLFCASASAMLAKMAKSDGLVSQIEIRAVELSFGKLGFDSRSRTYAIEVFRRAKDDEHSIYEYAREFATAMDSIEVRELFYGLLWNIACADSMVNNAEMGILREIPSALRIRQDWFLYYSQKYGNRKSKLQKEGLSLTQAYAILGVKSSATIEEIKMAYRKLAKENHPDILRAQGLPDEMVAQAIERMECINEAWQRISKGRKI